MFLSIFLLRLLGITFDLSHKGQADDFSQKNTKFNENVSPTSQISDLSIYNANQLLKDNIGNFILYENTDIYPPNPYTPYPTYCTPAQLQKRQKLPQPKYVINGVVAAMVTNNILE